MANIFADIKTPYINSLTLKRVLSEAVKNNIFQKVMTKPNEAVTEKFSNDTNAAEIQVLRVKPVNPDAREIGATLHGGFWDDHEASMSETEAYGIQILQTIDRPIDIPEHAQDMISVDLLSQHTLNLAGVVARNINAVTLAAMLAKNFNNVAGFDKKNSNASTEAITAVDNNWVTKAGGKNYLDMVIEAGAHLDAGNEAQGIDAYPDDQRAVFIRATAKAELLKHMTAINGGVGVFDVAKSAGLDRDGNVAVATTGYVGTLANMPVYVLSDVGWHLIEKYLGLAPKALDKVVGVACSAVGTGRALAFNHAIKVVDAQQGQGVRLQPCYRFGAECWDALSVVPMFDSEFTNPVVGKDSALFVRGKGSRV